MSAPPRIRPRRVTLVQRETLEFVCEFVRETGHSPSEREVAGRFGICLNAAAGRLDGMREKGLLARREKGQCRAIVPALPPTLGDMALVAVLARRAGQ